jgi:DNA topoisomerase-2
VLDNTIDLRKKKSAEVSSIMISHHYDMVDEDEQYKYLVRLPMDSVTEENIEKIMSERDRKNKELELLLNTTEHEIWVKELDTLRVEYLKIHEKIQQEEKAKTKSKTKTTDLPSSSANLKGKPKVGSTKVRSIKKCEKNKY